MPPAARALRCAGAGAGSRVAPKGNSPKRRRPAGAGRRSFHIYGVARAREAGRADLRRARGHEPRVRPYFAGSPFFGSAFFGSSFFGSAGPSAASIAATTSLEDGVVLGSKRAASLPSRPTRNFVKFHLISPA